MSFFPKREPQINYERFRGKKFRNKVFKTGDTYTIYDGKYHVVDIVEDDGMKIVVTKKWIKHKNNWYYYAKPLCLMLYEICLFRDIPDEQRRKFFEINGEKYWY